MPVWHMSLTTCVKPNEELRNTRKAVETVMLLSTSESTHQVLRQYLNHTWSSLRTFSDSDIQYNHT